MQAKELHKGAERRITERRNKDASQVVTERGRQKDDSKEEHSERCEPGSKR